jgi:hypothetical protein
MSAVAMEMAKMLKKKNEKHKNDHSRLLAKQKLMKLDRNNIGNYGKVCPTDSNFFLAYLVPLDVDVVPIKFHQFLFGE